MTENDDLIFAEEQTAQANTSPGMPWKILIVDDDEFVHKVTTMVLADYTFEGKGLEFLQAFTAEEGKAVLREHDDIALILLDVVMETSHAGLDLAQWIRDDLGNDMVRIILRTGQPGEAPEQEVIFRYDINDYKEKSELTSQKLATTVTTAIRSFSDIRTIKRNRDGLVSIVKASPSIFRTRSLGDFASGILSLLASNFSLDDNSILAHASGLAAARENGHFEVIASTGVYEQQRGDTLESIEDKEALQRIRQAAEEKQTLFFDNSFAGYYETSCGAENVIYMHGAGPLEDNERELIELFSTNISVAFDNISLYRTIGDTQRELLFTLGGIVETRSTKVSNHVQRVAEYSQLIGKAIGMTEEKSECLKFASPMHDIGKIAIPDKVLLKPGKLSHDEFEIIKRHPVIGYEILKDSDKSVMRAAAKIALEHHERWDGSGYPQGIKGEEIGLMSRITTLADIFDSLDSRQVYRDAWPLEKILPFIRENSGTIFEPALVEAFMDNIDAVLTTREHLTEEKN